MKQGFLQVVSWLVIAAFCLLISPKARAAERSSAPASAATFLVAQTVPFELSSAGARLEQARKLQALQTSLAPSEALIQESERRWSSRLGRDRVKDTLFLFTLEMEGETVLYRVGSGFIEANYYIRDMDFTNISISRRQKHVTNWSALEGCKMDTPVGDGAILRLRAYLTQNDEKLYFYREITAIDKGGDLLYYDLDQQEAVKDEHYSFLFSTTGFSSASEAAEHIIPLDSVKTMEREWTYMSSDGRKLWKLDLTGVFGNGRCLDAYGSAEAISQDWSMEDADFRAVNTDAVAFVTVSRRVLGITVAKETYEFHLTTQ